MWTGAIATLATNCEMKICTGLRLPNNIQGGKRPSDTSSLWLWQTTGGTGMSGWSAIKQVHWLLAARCTNELRATAGPLKQARMRQLEGKRSCLLCCQAPGRSKDQEEQWPHKAGAQREQSKGRGAFSEPTSDVGEVAAEDAGAHPVVRHQPARTGGHLRAQRVERDGGEGAGRLRRRL